MNIKKLLVACLFAYSLCSCDQEPKITMMSPQVIPQPNHMEIKKGFFELDYTAGIESIEEFENASTFLRQFIETGSGWELSDHPIRVIRFKKNKSIKPEGYRLEINPNTINIEASTNQGAFYGVQTLRQLLPEPFENGTFSENKVGIPCLSITDEPRFSYRGMHLDVSRHMFSVSFIKSYIDALSMLKINRFHWHLTDDQGWRIEIKKYPKLQEIAAFREKTLKGHYNDEPVEYQNERYGGFYTQEEIREVVAYALDRHVTIIPEIEMPGHAMAALSSYPELGCSGEEMQAATTWGVFEDIFCSKEETFQFLEGVLDEVADLFPGEYIHIGGDEAPKSKWRSCENCQKRIQEEGLKDEYELQSYFIKRIERHLNTKGKRIIGWDEILEGGLSPSATVMSWRGFEGAIDAAKQGNNVIMTPTSHCYFDYYQSEGPQEPLAIGGFLPLEKVYGFEPVPKELNKQETEHILGAQANLWTEYIADENHVEYMVFPRILALSEVDWTIPQKKDYQHFIERVEHFHERLDALKINYANHLYEVEGEVTTINNQSVYSLHTLTKNKTIRYSTDGSSPTEASKIYDSPIPFSEDMIITAAVFGEEKKIGADFRQNLLFHKGVGKSITLNAHPHKAYQGSGANGLLNGLKGSDTRYGDKEWLGFWGDDLEITIDFDQEIEIHAIETRFFDGPGQWIYAPEKVILEVDGKQRVYPVKKRGESLVNFRIATKIKAKSLTLKIPNFGVIPEGKQGAGNKAWTFIDEIIIK